MNLSSPLERCWGHDNERFHIAETSLIIFHFLAVMLTKQFDELEIQASLNSQWYYTAAMPDYADGHVTTIFICMKILGLSQIKSLLLSIFFYSWLRTVDCGCMQKHSSTVNLNQASSRLSVCNPAT